jgi:hypothetical protein
MALRLLIAAGGTAANADALPSGIRSLIDAAEDVTVIAPTLPTRFEWITSATDKATTKADARLETVLGHLGEVGVEGRGQVGSDDPLVALADAIREFSPNHLLIVLRRRDRAGWQERGLLDGIVELFSIPMTVFQLPDE